MRNLVPRPMEEHLVRVRPQEGHCSSFLVRGTPSRRAVFQFAGGGTSSRTVFQFARGGTCSRRTLFQFAGWGTYSRTLFQFAAKGFLLTAYYNCLTSDIRRSNAHPKCSLCSYFTDSSYRPIAVSN
jgi:hypothetical protein